MGVALMGEAYVADMQKEIGTHSESESASQILLTPIYLGMIGGVVVAGVFFASILLI